MSEEVTDLLGDHSCYLVTVRHLGAAMFSLLITKVIPSVFSSMWFSGHPLKAEQAVFSRVKFVSTKTIGSLFVDIHLHVTSAMLGGSHRYSEQLNGSCVT